MEKKKVYLNEYNILLDNTAYLPYSTALLQAYAQKQPQLKKNYEFMPIIYARQAVDEIVKAYDNPQVAAFSVSLWNEQLSLSVAETIKAKFPECLVVFGGASVPFFPEDYFSRHKFIDVAIRGEGERAFSAVLERYLDSRDFGTIGNVSYRDPKTGLCVRNAQAQPLVADNNLDIFPSPYLEGVFEPLMVGGLKWQAVLETNRGCPFLCSYCFWGQGGLSRKVVFFGLERIRQEIDWCGRQKIAYIFCADGNFGMFERDLKITDFLVETKTKYNFPERFRVNYSKTTDERVISVASVLHKHKLEKSITMSLQSYNEQALSNVKRKNIKMKVFHVLQERFKAADVSTYTELILGLPGETDKSWEDGMETCLQNSINNDIFVYLLQIYPNTELADPQYQKKHGIKFVHIPLNEGHGAVRSAGIPAEYENVVVASNVMSEEDWKKSAVLSWLVQAMMGLKLGYFILIYLADRYRIKYLDFIKYLAAKKMPWDCNFLKKLIKNAYALADSIISGNSRTAVLEDFGCIYWEPEEAFYLKVIEDKDGFYDELLIAIKDFLKKIDEDFNVKEVEEVLKYQRLRVPQLTLPKMDNSYFEYNVAQYYEDYFTPNKCSLKKLANAVTLDGAKDFKADKKTFAREIILFGRKSNRMLYPVKWASLNKAKV